MPVLPLVGSSSSRPGWSSPAASAVSIIDLATRSLIEPVGFAPSSFAYSRTDGFGARRESSTSGVLPTRSSRLGARRLAKAPPDVDRGAELAEQLVDGPGLVGRVRVGVAAGL